MKSVTSAMCACGGSGPVTGEGAAENSRLSFNGRLTDGKGV